MTKVSGSILSSTLSATDIIREFNKTDMDFIHLDIMDAKFVPNKTWPYSEIKKLVSYTNKKLDVHLMVKNPQKYLEDYALLNTEYFTFHYEAVKNIKEIIDEVKIYGLKVGVSIKPDTNIDVLVPYLKDIDLVLIMSVEPGKSGQSFIESSIEKIAELKSIITKNNYKAVIEVDGGINNETGIKCVEAGVDILVSASYLHKDIVNNLKVLKDL